MTNTLVILSVIGGLVILGLAAYAVHLLLLVKQQKKEKEENEAKRVAALNKQNQKHLTSVKIIVDAMLEEQCDVSEGCWRLSVLLGNVQMPDQDFEADFPAIFDLYERIRHMPIMEARKALNKRDRMKLDFERMKHEAELQEQIDLNITALKERTSELLKRITAPH